MQFNQRPGRVRGIDRAALMPPQPPRPEFINEPAAVPAAAEPADHAALVVRFRLGIALFLAAAVAGGAGVQWWLG